MKPLIEIKNCVLCATPASEATVLFDLKENQKLLQCLNCDMIFNSHCRIDFENIYSEDYYETSELGTAGGYFAYDKMEPAIKKTYRFEISFIKKTIRDNGRDLSLLDIGCGYGFFIKQFLDVPHIELMGIEPSQKAASEASKVIPDIIREPFESVDLAKKFDYIVLLEVIEHLLDPVAFLEKIHNCLKKDGYLILATPNVGSYYFKILKRRWPGIHPDSHNFYFSSKTIKTIAERCGFEIVGIREKHFFYINIRHIRKRLLELFGAPAKIFGVFKVFDFIIIPFLNGGDLRVILRKREQNGEL